MLVLLKFISLTSKAIHLLCLVLFVPKLNFSDANPFINQLFTCLKVIILSVDS